MDEAQVKKKVFEIIIDQLAVESADVTPEASFIDDLGADSLDLVELIMALEEEFELTISDEEAEGFKTVGKALEYVQKHLT